MRTAAAFGGGDVDEALFAAAGRFRSTGDGYASVQVLAEILGRRWASRDSVYSWPPPELSDMGSAPAESGPKGPAEGREALTRMAAIALRDGKPELLGLVLEVALATGTDVDAGTLDAALRTVREETCWYLARAGTRRLPRPLIEAATTSPSAEDDLPFACEIVARLAGRPLDRPPRRDWTSPTGRESAKRIPLDPIVVEKLTLAERKDLSLALGGQAQALEKGLALSDRRMKARRFRPSPFDPSLPASISLLDLAAFPPGYVEDVLAATGCRKAPSDVWAGAQIKYKEDGRPQNVTTSDSNQALESCQAAARLLFMTGLAPPSPKDRRGGTHILFVRLDRESLECALAPPDPAAKPGGSWGSRGVPVGGAIEEPRKTKNVPPVYPASARQRGVQGVVILEAVIMPSGCVGGLAVIGHADPALDMSALRAVAEWRYTPTLLNGKAVSVIMTVTVNFRLS
jgi:protein TonB